MGSERREQFLKTLLFGVALLFVVAGGWLILPGQLAGLSDTGERVGIWAGQVLIVLASTYIGIYVADRLSKRPQERANDIFAAMATDSIKQMINDAVSVATIPRIQTGPYRPGMRLFFYYVSGNRKIDRYWQLSVVTIDFRVSAGTWIGVSTIEDADGKPYDYVMEIKTIKDMIVVASSQAPEQRERSAIYVFDSRMPERRVFGILSHIDWRGQARLDPAILVLENPHTFRDGTDPCASTRISDPDRMAELDQYFKDNVNVIGLIDRCFGKLLTKGRG